MEGGQYHNPNNADVVTAERELKPSNEAPANKISTKSTGDPKLPYKNIYLWVKDVNYSDEPHRKYAPMRISEEDHSPKTFSLTISISWSAH